MLLNSGTPSLISYTRDLLGDATTAASPQWSDTNLKAALNDAYLRLRAIAKTYRAGSGLKRSYADGVADQKLYEKPAGLTHLEAVEVSGNGSNLATASPSSAQAKVLKPWPAEKALNDYDIGAITTPERVFIQGEHFGIVAPPTSAMAGTNSIAILYGASSTLLVNDTDEPDLPRDHHFLLCYRACIPLKIGRDMDVLELKREVIELEYEFRVAMQEELSMYADEIDTAGTRVQATSIISGTVRST